MKPPTPQHLAELYHMVIADQEVEPVSWTMSAALWTDVTRVADEDLIVADPAQSGRELFGLPVDIGKDHPFAPVLYIRKHGMVVPVPVIGDLAEV